MRGRDRGESSNTRSAVTRRGHTALHSNQGRLAFAMRWLARCRPCIMKANSSKRAAGSAWNAERSSTTSRNHLFLCRFSTSGNGRTSLLVDWGARGRGRLFCSSDTDEMPKFFLVQLPTTVKELNCCLSFRRTEHGSLPGSNPSSPHKRIRPSNCSPTSVADVHRHQGHR